MVEYWNGLVFIKYTDIFISHPERTFFLVFFISTPNFIIVFNPCSEAVITIYFVWQLLFMDENCNFIIFLSEFVGKKLKRWIFCFIFIFILISLQLNVKAINFSHWIFFFHQKKKDHHNIQACLTDQSFRQKVFWWNVCLRKRQSYPVYTIKVFIPSYLSTVNSKTSKVAELDLDSKQVFWLVKSHQSPSKFKKK